MNCVVLTLTQDATFTAFVPPFAPHAAPAQHDLDPTDYLWTVNGTLTCAALVLGSEPASAITRVLVADAVASLEQRLNVFSEIMEGIHRYPYICSSSMPTPPRVCFRRSAAWITQTSATVVHKVGCLDAV